MAGLWDRQYGPPVSGAASVASQVAQNVQANNPGPIPAVQSITSTAETLIASQLNNTIALQVFLPPNRAWEQTLFNLVASGIMKTTASGSLTIKVYEGAAIASGNLLGSSGAITQNSATAAWYYKAELMFDSTTGTLVGSIKFYINKTIVAEVTLSNFVTGITNTGDPVASFCFSVTSSGAGTGTPTTITTQKISCG